MKVVKQCKICKRKTLQDRTVKRKVIKYICECGKIRIHQYPRNMKDGEKAVYLKKLEMLV